MELNDYYEDRGIVKFNGFFLSEHTTALNNEACDNSHYNAGKDEMTPEQMTEILDYSILKNLPVAIQLNFTLGDGLGFPDDVIGLVRGYDDIRLLIDETYVYFSTIRHVEITTIDKWYH